MKKWPRPLKGLNFTLVIEKEKRTQFVLNRGFRRRAGANDLSEITGVSRHAAFAAPGEHENGAGCRYNGARQSAPAPAGREKKGDADRSFEVGKRARGKHLPRLSSTKVAWADIDRHAMTPAHRYQTAI